jgi:hypothetical protein
MIRAVSIVSLLTLLALVLYLPAAYPPQRFIEQLRNEHRLNAAFWGQDHATRILSRMLDFQAQASQASPVPSLSDAPATKAVDTAVANEFAQVNRRLFNNPYFRSIDALFTLTTYRFSALIEWLPLLLVFMAGTLFDGFLMRIVRSKEFVQHNPEMYAVYLSAAIMTACSTVIAFVLPIKLPVLALPAVPVLASVFVSRAVANFHRRG